MEADEAGGKDGRRPRLIETCHFISFSTKMKTVMRNALYFSAFELGTFSTALPKNGYSFGVTKWPVCKDSVIRQNFGQCKVSGTPIVLESQPTDSLRPAIVQEFVQD